MNMLKKLAENVGISSTYIDKTGKEHLTKDCVRHYFLNAMGIKTTTEADIAAALEQSEKKPLLPEVLPFFDNEEFCFSLNADGKFELHLTDENNNIIWQTSALGRQSLLLPKLDAGYYTLWVNKDSEKFKSLVIIAPVLCYQPEFIKNKEHLYGVSLMLYALRSKNSMGIGDFSDLAEIVRLTAANGGDAVGINPLGVMSPYTLPSPFMAMLKGDVSPYRSLSRLFINYIYLDLHCEVDFQSSVEISTMMADETTLAEIERLNNSPNVIYGSVLRFKLHLLSLMYQTFLNNKDTQRKQDFEDWKKQKGDELNNLCLFEV